MLNVKYLDQTDCIILHNLFHTFNDTYLFCFLPSLIVSVDPMMGSLFQLWIVLWNRATKHRGSPSMEQMTSGWHSGSVAYAFFLIWSGLRKAFTHPAMYFPSISSPLLGSSFSPRFVTVFYIFWPKFCPFLVFAYLFLAWLSMDLAETMFVEEWRTFGFDSFSSLSDFAPPTSADLTGNNSCGAVCRLLPFQPIVSEYLAGGSAVLLLKNHGAKVFSC